MKDKVSEFQIINIRVSWTAERVPRPQNERFYILQIVSSLNVLIRCAIEYSIIKFI